MRIQKLIVAVTVLLIVGMVAVANWRDARPPARAALRPPVGTALRPPVGTPGGLSTSRADLEREIVELRARLEANAADVPAAAPLADALLRLSRATGDSTLTLEAERVLKRALGYDASHYRSLRMLAAIHLSQHRFADAVETATRASLIHPDDAWNYGTMGDGYIELGQYEQAFAAFDRMMQVRPSAAGYARVSYAWEIKGDRREAIETMTMAAESTTADDPEAQAWQYTQLGHLLMDAGRQDEATREFQRALYTYPNYALAAIGLAKLKMAAGATAEARAAFRALFDAKPTPEVAMHLGDLDAAAGDQEGAERYYAIVETGWKFDTTEPVLLSKFLSERNRRPDEALALAEEAGKVRQDIFTADALAWALFRKGRVADAAAASQRARRTGTRDRVILTHAAAIQDALGHRHEARRLVTLALDGHPRFDLVVAPLATSLQARLDGTKTLAMVGR